MVVFKEILVYSTPLTCSLLPQHLYHAPHHHTDALFPTMYLVLVLMTSLYGKRGRDLCASLYLRQQTCNDMQGFIVLPIFVETVSLPTPYYQILRSPPSSYPNAFADSCCSSFVRHIHSQPQQMFGGSSTTKIVFKLLTRLIP